MISVFCRGLTSEARQIITETFGFAQVGADKLRIIDLDYYDLDVTKHNFIFITIFSILSLKLCWLYPDNLQTISF